MEIGIETVLGIVTGIGLSAACGFRVFVPLLMMNLMAMGGYLNLSPEFSWIGSPYATAAFATATAVEKELGGVRGVADVSGIDTAEDEKAARIQIIPATGPRSASSRWPREDIVGSCPTTSTRRTKGGWENRIT